MLFPAARCLRRWTVVCWGQAEPSAVVVTSLTGWIEGIFPLHLPEFSLQSWSVLWVRYTGSCWGECMLHVQNIRTTCCFCRSRPTTPLWFYTILFCSGGEQSCTKQARYAVCEEFMQQKESFAVKSNLKWNVVNSIYQHISGRFSARSIVSFTDLLTTCSKLCSNIDSEILYQATHLYSGLSQTFVSQSLIFFRNAESLLG